jgi:hypothetical protein
MMTPISAKAPIAIFVLSGSAIVTPTSVRLPMKMPPINNDWNRELSLSDGITVTERLSGTPVQYVGQCDGQWYYFRARHQRWRMAIASNAEAATGATSSMVDRGPDREVGQQSPIQTTDAIVFFYADGFYGAEPDAAGYMPLEQAEEIIRRCVRLWRAAQIEQK